MTAIYRVESINVDRNYTLAYATGDVEDIEKYFDKNKAYGLLLVEIKPIHVTHEMATEITNIYTEKEELERRLAEINRHLETKR